MGDKITALLSLKKEIKDEISKSFFFSGLEGCSCKGWLGTSSVLFVSLNASTSTFPTEADKFYYSTLEEFGFENAHLSDLFKEVMTGREFDALEKDSLKFHEVFEKNRRWLNREIEILGGDVKLIAVGRKAFNLLKRVFDDKRLYPDFLRHYSWACRWNKIYKFRESLMDVKRWIDGTKKTI
jgi:hypothetical protein